MDYIIPDYLNMDYETFKANVISSLENNEVFKDYNFEGSNITVLIELISYLAELNTYYQNRIAKNLFFDSVDMYENANRLANFIGYTPQGSLGASSTLTLTLSADSSLIGHTLTLEGWKKFSSSESTDDGDTIYFTTLNPQNVTVDATGTFTFDDVYVKQGELKEYTYSGSDLIDNTLYLPFIDFGFDDDLTDDYDTLELYINEEQWTRISNFYDTSSLLTDDEDNVFTFKFNKYKEYIIEFSDNKNVPSDSDEIYIKLIKTLGADGNVGANTITTLEDDECIYDNDTSSYIDTSYIISITNDSIASGGSNAEDVDSIKDNAKGILNSQYRAVTSSDYSSILELNSNIQKANVWGEQDVNPDGGNTEDYNKVYCSILPSGEPEDWSYLPTITYLTDNDTTLYYPTTYTDNFKTLIKEWIEPYKILTTYEIFEVPDFVYLAFNFSLTIKRMYSYSNVINDLKNKLSYYFEISNRSFGEEIDIYDLKEFLLDSTECDDSDDYFTNIKGINNLEIRDIKFYSIDDEDFIDPYDYNSSSYPQYSKTVSSNWDENTIRSISLNFNQFPFLDINSCVFEEE